MIRLTFAETLPRTLRLEGRLTGRVLPEFERVCLEAAENQPLQLDLAGVRFLDPAGVGSICRLMDLGVRVTGGSPFVNELLKECRS